MPFDLVALHLVRVNPHALFLHRCNVERLFLSFSVPQNISLVEGSRLGLVLRCLFFLSRLGFDPHIRLFVSGRFGFLPQVPSMGSIPDGSKWICFIESENDFTPALNLSIPLSMFFLLNFFRIDTAFSLRVWWSVSMTSCFSNRTFCASSPNFFQALTVIRSSGNVWELFGTVSLKHLQLFSNSHKNSKQSKDFFH